MMGMTAFLIMMAFNVSLSSRNNSVLSDLALANVEVLALEGGGWSNCTIVGYTEAWSGGCLYNCAVCGEGHFQAINLIYCVGR